MYLHQFGWLSERRGKLFKFASERRVTQKGRGVPTLEAMVQNKWVFFPKFLATHKKLLSMKLELEVTFPLRLPKGPFYLNF